MKKTLQLLAVLVLLAAGATWLATGANRGWTKTSVAVKTLDPVTAIDGISYEKKFLPGVDFLGAAALGAGLLAGASLFFRNKNKPQTDTKRVFSKSCRSRGDEAQIKTDQRLLTSSPTILREPQNNNHHTNYETESSHSTRLSRHRCLCRAAKL